MQNTPFKRIVALTATLTTNLLNPPTLTGGVGVAPTKTFIQLKLIRVINTTSGPLPVSFFLGATGAAAAGTEVGGSALSVLGNSFVDIPLPPSGLPMETADFLTGGSTSTGLTALLLGEIGIRP